MQSLYILYKNSAIPKPHVNYGQKDQYAIADHHEASKTIRFENIYVEKDEMIAEEKEEGKPKIIKYVCLYNIKKK